MARSDLQTLTIDTPAGAQRRLAPAGWTFDKTAVRVWSALLQETRIKNFKRQRDKFMTEAKIEALANVLANSIGMAATYWILRARDIAPLDPDKADV